MWERMLWFTVMALQAAELSQTHERVTHGETREGFPFALARFDRNWGAALFRCG